MITLQVEGYPRMRYMFYSKREAMQRYRQQFNLKGKHLTWLSTKW